MEEIIIRKDFKDLIPPLSDDEYRQLEENILSDGIRDPLVLWGNVLIDGHNRYSIAQKHGLKFETISKDFANENEVIHWIILNQFGRRNLSAYDRSILALKLKPVIAKEKEKNLHLSSGKGVKGKQISADVNDTRQELAKVAGVSHDTISKVEKIERDAPKEIKEQVASGKLSINQGYQIVRRKEKIAAVEQRIEEHANDQTGVIDIKKPDRKYNIIYADPPWKYWEGGNKNQSLHYTLMTIDEICEIPVKDLADDNCVLFLWVTYPILPDAFRVIESWGFRYSTAAFVWVKKNRNADTPFIGCGSWTRANSELCLMATKGNVLRLDASISQVVESPIEEHSKKPDVVRDLITKLVGELPRVELFCRNPAEGWDVWGNEA